MKKSVVIAVLIFILFPVLSAECSLNVSMINQDPYPAIPGEPVKVVFQINGVSDPDCGTVKFEVKESFPFTVDPGSENPITINSGIYAKRYSSYYIAPYTLRINEDALEGNNPLEVGYSSSSTTVLGERLNDFNIYIEDTRADFEVFVKDYEASTQTLTLEILNIEDVDVEALTVEIPQQENIEIKKTDRVVVGDLDSNEYTTADFEATPKNGEIKIKIIYTDSVNVRREIEKTVMFDQSYFEGLTRDKQSGSVWVYVIVLAVIGFFVWRWYKKRQRKKLHHRE
jgi:hypothetical protein